jgi:hypothetical protein
MRKGKMPSIRSIAEAQVGILRRLDIAPEDAQALCWACFGQGKLQRAHIVAKCDGGGYEPSNFFLLCSTCHAEQPDGAPADVQIDWLASHEAETTRLARISIPVCHWIARQLVDEEVARDQHEEMLRFITSETTMAASNHRGCKVNTKLWSAAKRFVDSVKAYSRE